MLVTSKKAPVIKAAKNLGLDVVEVSSLNASLLAPGAEPGRLIIITKSAVEKIGKENLFV